MDDRTIQTAVHVLHEDYAALAGLPTCYETRGGRPVGDGECAGIPGEPTGEDR